MFLRRSDGKFTYFTLYTKKQKSDAAPRASTSPTAVADKVSPLPEAPKMPGTIKAGVLTGDDLLALMNDARSKGYAIPAVNVTR